MDSTTPIENIGGMCIAGAIGMAILCAWPWAILSALVGVACMVKGHTDYRRLHEDPPAEAQQQTDHSHDEQRAQ